MYIYIYGYTHVPKTVTQTTYTCSLHRYSYIYTYDQASGVPPHGMVWWWGGAGVCGEGSGPLPLDGGVMRGGGQGSYASPTQAINPIT